MNSKRMPVDQDEVTKELDVSLPLPMAVAEQQSAVRPKKRPYPKKVLFIVGDEFCERYSYYGLRTILVLYLINALGFSDHKATITYHLFCALCYLMPLFGAILGDSLLGKFKTILYLSIVYFFGEVILLLSSIFWYETEYSVPVALSGLVLIGIGTGGIKPCVSGFGGDQFLAHEHKWRNSFFSLFYVAVSLGSLLTMFITPVFRSHFQCVHRTDCYPYAFGLPCLIMLTGIIVFVSAKNQYYIAPLPERNVILAFIQCIWLALMRKISGKKMPTQPLTTNLEPETLTQYGSLRKQSSSRGTAVTGCDHWLYLASDRFDKKSIEEFKAVLGILALFAPLPIFWTLFDQQGSLWTLQAARMDGNLFNIGYVLEPDQMLVLHPILLLISIPLFDLLIYPCAGHFRMLRDSISRLTFGGFLLALAFLGSALIEMRIQHFYPVKQPEPDHSLIQLVNSLDDQSLLQVEIIPALQVAAYIPINQPADHLINVGPSGAHLFSVESSNTSESTGYKLSFELSAVEAPMQSSQVQPFSQHGKHEFNIAPIPEGSVKLLYIERKNQTTLSYRLFDDDHTLASSGKARVRLLYEFSGSPDEAKKRHFHLLRVSSSGLLANTEDTTFNTSGQQDASDFLLSDYLSVTVPASGDYFVLRTEDGLVGSHINHEPIQLEPGTRSLIVVQESQAIGGDLNVQIRFELLQDNRYRINMLYQFVPYLLHAMADMVFSIAGLQFSYTMAPDNMKSVILAIWYMTTAIGNLLTVLIESLSFSTNMAHNFLFYAAILAVDMLVFAFIGVYYKPNKTNRLVTAN